MWIMASCTTQNDGRHERKTIADSTWPGLCGFEQQSKRYGIVTLLYIVFYASKNAAMHRTTAPQFPVRPFRMRSQSRSGRMKPVYFFAFAIQSRTRFAPVIAVCHLFPVWGFFSFQLHLDMPASSPLL
jgi:hypothetical protein